MKTNQAIKMSVKNNTLYTTQEIQLLDQLTKDYDNGLITNDYLQEQSIPLIKKYEERKNRIRHNEITPLDKKRGFTPENFPYLTQFSKEYYPKDKWNEL
jgi:hypothetical protein